MGKEDGIKRAQREAEENLVWRVEEAIECAEWLNAMPFSMYGTRMSERAWDFLGEKLDNALTLIGAEKDEAGCFLCYDENGGPMEVLEKWLEGNGEAEGKKEETR